MKENAAAGRVETRRRRGPEIDLQLAKSTRSAPRYFQRGSFHRIGLVDDSWPPQNELGRFSQYGLDAHDGCSTKTDSPNWRIARRAAPFCLRNASQEMTHQFFSRPSGSSHARSCVLAGNRSRSWTTFSNAVLVNRRLLAAPIVAAQAGGRLLSNRKFNGFSASGWIRTGQQRVQIYAEHRRSPRWTRWRFRFRLPQDMRRRECQWACPYLR